MDETQQILNELILQAESGEHLEFRFLRTWKEYRILRRSRKAMKHVIKILQHSTDSLLKAYCEDIELGTTNTSKLLAGKILDKTTQFYQQEYETLDLMLGEYEIYIVSGNLFDFVWYGGRPEKKLWDHRRFFNGDVNDESV